MNVAQTAALPASRSILMLSSEPVVSTVSTVGRLQSRAPRASLFGLTLTALLACAHQGLAATVGLRLDLTAGLQTPRQIEEEVRFARGLASEWQFVDLAQGVLDKLQSSNLTAEQRESIELARCDVFAAGARSERNDLRREELYQTALSAYQSFLSKYANSTRSSEAKRLYVDLGVEYGIVTEGLLDTMGASQAQVVRASLAERMKELSKFASDLEIEMPAASEQSEAELVERYKLMTARGNLYLILGRAEEDGSYSNLDRADEVLTDLIYKAGSETGFGLNAWNLMGQVAAARGDQSTAVDCYDYVMSNVIPEDEEVWDEVKKSDPRSVLETRWLYYQKNCAPLILARLALGKDEAAAKAALRFYNLLNREGFDLAKPEGYVATLAAARALLAAGGYVGGSIAAGDLAWYPDEDSLDASKVSKRNRRTAIELALQLASRVNQENRGNILQVRAQRLIADAIDLPGISVTPDILFEAAQGAYNSQDFSEALRGMRRVMESLSNDADRTLYMPKVLWHMGSSLRRMDRELEAAMAYREALTAWRGDSEWDSKNADGFYGVMNQLRRSAKGDTSIEALFRESEVLKAGLGEGGADDILWRQADREFTAENFSGAREGFLKLPEDSKYLEKALVRAAVSLYKQKQLDEAEAELERYEGKYLSDPRNQLRSGDTVKLKFRSEARAESRYYRGQIARDKQDWKAVIGFYTGFADDFPGQGSLIAASQYYLIEAHLNLAQRDQADALLAKLVQEFPGESLTGSAGKLVYIDYAQRAEGLDHSSAEYKDLAGRMAKALELANGLSDEADFGALKNEANLWFELGTWDKALPLYERLAEDWGQSKDDSTQKQITTYILPRLAECLLAVRRIPEAHQILRALVPDVDDRETDKRVAPGTVELFVRSVIGWLEGPPNDLTLVPGVGGEKELRAAAGWLNRLGAKLETWSCDWYHNQWQSIVAWLELSKVDTSAAGTAANLLSKIRGETGSDFSGVATTCDANLQNQFRWLAGQVL